MVARKGTRQVARFEAVDDLYRATGLGVLHHLEDAVLDDNVSEVEGLELLDGDRRDERRARVLLGVGGVEAVLILDIDHRSGTKHLADQVGAGVGPVGGNPPDLRIGLPERVRGHSEEDDRLTL